MNIFLKELINRIINYLIKVSKGDDYNEKIEQLLKKSLMVSFLALLLSGTMSSKYLVASWYLQDLEKSFGKIDNFMVTQQDNMNQLFRINGDQYNTIVKLGKENKEIRNDVRRLLNVNESLAKEVDELRSKQQKKESSNKK